MFEALWQKPGFAFWFGNFGDLMMNPEVNAHACDFVRRKIRARVHDPELLPLAASWFMYPDTHLPPGFGVFPPLFVTEPPGFNLVIFVALALVDVPETEIEGVRLLLPHPPLDPPHPIWI